MLFRNKKKELEDYSFLKNLMYKIAILCKHQWAVMVKYIILLNNTKVWVMILHTQFRNY